MMAIRNCFKSKRFQDIHIFDMVTFLSFFGLTFLILTGLQVFNFSHATTDIAAVVTQTGYYINTSSSSINNSITLNVEATVDGALAMAKDVLNIRSNSPDGYQVYIAMADKPGCVSNCNALYNDNNRIDATSGTFSNPVALSSNTWGYAIKNGMSGAPVNGFSSNYNVDIPDNSALFSALPLKGDDQLIQVVESPNSTDGVDAEIFYGAKVNTAIPSGVYRGVIAYTVIARNADGSTDILNVSPNETKSLGGGETITIATDYAFAEENLGDVKVYVNSLTTSKECTNLATIIENDRLKITCDTPAYDTGKYDVRVVIPGYNKDVTVARAINYYVDSAESKNLKNTFISSFDSDSLSATLPSDYYSGDTTLALSDVVSVYSQEYDSSKTAEQNTQDAGITYDSDVIVVEEGYHKRQEIPKPASTPGILASMFYNRWSSSSYSYNAGTFIANRGLNIDCHKLTVNNFLYVGNAAQSSGSVSEEQAILQVFGNNLTYNNSNCVVTVGSTTDLSKAGGHLFMNGGVYLVVLNPDAYRP